MPVFEPYTGLCGISRSFPPCTPGTHDLLVTLLLVFLFQPPDHLRLRLSCVNIGRPSVSIPPLLAARRPDGGATKWFFIWYVG